MTNSELDGQLGHSAKGSLKHYLKAYQIPKDVNHIHIIQEFGILNILGCLIDKTVTMTELVNSDEVKFHAWESDIYVKNNPTLLAIQTINLGELTLWSVEDEKRYQTLLLKESKGKWQMINGVNTKVEVTAKMFSEELKELIKQKETIINDLDEKESKRALAYLKINSLKVYKKLRAFEKFEKTNPSPIEMRKVTNPYG